MYSHIYTLTHTHRPRPAKDNGVCMSCRQNMKPTIITLGKRGFLCSRRWTILTTNASIYQSGCTTCRGTKFISHIHIHNHHVCHHDHLIAPII